MYLKIRKSEAWSKEMDVSGLAALHFAFNTIILFMKKTVNGNMYTIGEVTYYFLQNAKS